MYRLNIGCGRDYKQGFINIDAVEDVKPDLVLDLLKKWPFADGSVSKIIAKDILEHFTYEQLSEHVLPEISRVLADGGQIELRVPNPDDIIKRFGSDPEVRNTFLYGATDETGTFGAHKVGFTKNSLLYLLIRSSLWPNIISYIQTNFVIACEKRSLNLANQKINFSVNWWQIAKNSLNKCSSIWVVSPSLIQEISNGNLFLKYAFRLVKNLPTLVVAADRNQKNRLMQALRVSLAKIRTPEEGKLSSIIKEAKIRHLIIKRF